MTDREQLLVNCLNEPADDQARLVYADFLRESDDTFDNRLGAFIWAGVTMSAFRGQEVIEDGIYAKAAAELVEAAPAVMGTQLRAIFGDASIAWPAWNNKCDVVTASPHVSGPEQVIYKRGMLSGLKITLSRFREFAARVLAVCPLEHVEVLDVPGLTFRISCEIDPGRWQLVGELKLPERRSGWRRYAPTTITEPWSIGSREKIVSHIVWAIDDTIELLHSQAGDRWPRLP
jgi:uncharacterized protein (TIGR02996 family)